MTFKHFIIYILLLSLTSFQFCSCTSKNKETTTAQAAATETYMLQALDDSIVNLEQDENKMELYKADFERMGGKPILRFYNTTIDGQKVLVTETSTVNGEESLSHLNININIIGQNPEPFTDDDQEEELTIYEEKGLKYLKHSHSAYKLSEIRDIAIEAYSNLDYTITTVNSTKQLEPDEYWNNIVCNYEYNQSFVAVSKTGLYNEVLASDAFLDIIRGEQRADISKWSHKLNYDTIHTDEVAFVGWSVSSIQPLRFDSTVFIVSEQLEVYMGGAHGMFYTTMYNFDVKTGDLLELSDIVDIGADEYNLMLEEAVMEQYDSELGDESPSTFTIYADGIELTFPPYSLGGGSWQKCIFLSYHQLQNVLVRELYPIKK